MTRLFNPAAGRGLPSSRYARLGQAPTGDLQKECCTTAGVTSLHARNGWSTMANAWRDIHLTDQAGIYVGGGIGAGGYRCAFHGENLGTTVTGTTGITSFAWQAGGGAIYAFSDRVTLDLGYRFFSLGSGTADIYTTNAAGTLSDTVKTQFVASEALLTLRIYEPFRRWR